MQDTDESVDSTSKVLISIMMSASLSKEGESFGNWNTTTSAEHTSNEQWRISFAPDFFHIRQLGCANRICGESGSFRRDQHSASLSHNPNQDVRTTMHRDNLEYLIRASLPNPKTQ